jgi:HlyD family secretion protein
MEKSKEYPMENNSAVLTNIKESHKNLFKKQSKMKKWIFLSAACAFVLVFVWICMRLAGSNPMLYKTQNSTTGDLTILVTATGTMKPTKQVDVGSETSGIIKTVEVNYNDKVKVGQVLARIDTSKLEAQVTQSKAALEATAAKVRQTRATLNEATSKLAQYDHVRKLSNNQVPSENEYLVAQAVVERAKADEASAVASESQAKATLEAFETDLSKAIIHSPINGIVLTRSIEPGQTVAATLQTPVLFTLAEDLTQMELHVDVDEADISQVKEGQEATFSVDAYPNRRFTAQIIQTRYGSKTVDGVVTYETVLKVDNSDLALRPGMTATADIVVQKVQNALLVPNAALRFTMQTESQSRQSRGLVGALLPRPPIDTKKPDTKEKGNVQKIWVLNDKKPSELSVTTGVSDGTMTEITGGEIKPEMAVIIEAVSKGK